MWKTKKLMTAMLIASMVVTNTMPVYATNTNEVEIKVLKMQKDGNNPMSSRGISNNGGEKSNTNSEPKFVKANSTLDSDQAEIEITDRNSCEITIKAQKDSKYKGEKIIFKFNKNISQESLILKGNGLELKFIKDKQGDFVYEIKEIDFNIARKYILSGEILDQQNRKTTVNVSVNVTGEDTENIIAFGNEFEIGTSKEFSTGTLNGLAIDDSIGDGALVIEKDKNGYKQEGIYISEEIDVPNFEYMVASWNSDTPEGTYVEMEARVLVNHFDENNNLVQTWSNWLSWGSWSPFIERASADTEDLLAKTSTDELVIKGSKGETSSKVQVRVKLHSNNPEVTPTIRYLHGTLKNTLDGQGIDKYFKEDMNVTNLNKDIATPEYSQMIRCPRIKNSICSPTTITMMMNRFGETLLPEEVAQNTYDNNYGFGNWAFAIASAGSYGYKAYADYTTIEGLKREIAKGYPVGVSVKYSNVTNDKYPYVEGAPGRTGGHLILVRGFETVGGVDYVIVNDSYGLENETVRRKYRLDQFEKAWSNRLAYIIHDKEANAGASHTKRIDANLKSTEQPNEYKVFVGEENIDVQNFGGTIAYTTDNDTTYKYFPKIKDKNSLTFSEEEINNPNLKVYVITDIGKVYVTRVVK